MQVYRGMDIGTAKPTPREQDLVRHHLVDVADPAEAYSVAEFQDAGRRALDDIARRGRHAVICGGSGLHFRALVDPLEFPASDVRLRAELEKTGHEALVDELLAADPDAAKVVDLANPRRVLRAVEIHRLTGRTPSGRALTDEAAAVRRYEPVIPFTAIGLDPGAGLATRVERRLAAMIAAGWQDEVRRLAPTLGKTASHAVGYREMLRAVRGEIDASEAREAVLRSTLALAKRQRTFFGKDPRIRWLAWHDDPDERLAAATGTLEEADAWTS
jgi:tRNA dimethylallyltransferase